MSKDALKVLLFDAVRAVVYGVIIIMLLLVATALLGNTAQLQVKYEKAVACELAIPSDRQTGRDPTAVALCFTKEGLAPPTFVIEGP